MKKIWLGILLAAATTVQAAPTPSTELESSAVVKGTVVLARDGTVQAVSIDDETRYGKPIADLVRKAASQWLFYPVIRDGEPVVAKSAMYVRVVLRKTADGNYSARIKGATFGDMNRKSTEDLRNAPGNRMILPRYPMEAIHDRAQGTVYLALHVDRDGNVTDAVAEQVNMETAGSERMLTREREVLAKSALDVARRWHYVVPTTGPLAKQDSWTVHVPVRYTLYPVGRGPRQSAWVTYIPGPYTPAPWLTKSDTATADVLSEGGLLTEGAGPTLRSP